MERKGLLALLGLLSLVAVVLLTVLSEEKLGDEDGKVLLGQRHHKSAAEKRWDDTLAQKLRSLSAAEAEGKKAGPMMDRGEGFRGRGLGRTGAKAVEVRKRKHQIRDDGRGQKDHSSKNKLRRLERKLRQSRRQLQTDSDRLHVQNHMAKLREASLLRLLARQKSEYKERYLPQRQTRRRDWAGGNEGSEGRSEAQAPQNHRADRSETLADLVVHVKRVAARMKDEKYAFKNDRQELEHTKKLINRALSAEKQAIQKGKERKAEGAHGLGVHAMVMNTVDGDHSGNPFRMSQSEPYGSRHSSGNEIRAPRSYGADVDYDGLRQSGYRTGYHYHPGEPSVKSQNYLTSVFGAAANQKAQSP